MSRVDRKLKKFAMALGFIAASGLVAGTAFATVPVSITQQGRILQSNGEPLQGNQSLQFALYDSASGGTQLWGDSISADLGDNGVYSVTLGTSTQPIDADLLSGGTVYLELTAGGSAMSPRLELTSVPFSALAEVALNVADGSITSAALAPGAVTWNQISDVPSSVTADTLAGLSCSGSQIAIYDGSNWGCGNLPAGGGTYDGTDFALSNQSCSGDQVAVGITSSGALVCDNQQDTTYSAGTGLSLNGTTFSVSTSYLNSNYLGLSTTTRQNVSGDIGIGRNTLHVSGAGPFVGDESGRINFAGAQIYAPFYGLQLIGSPPPPRSILIGSGDSGEDFRALDVVDGDIYVRAGRLGVNTTDPHRPIHVLHDNNYRSAIKFENSSNGRSWGVGIGASSNDFLFRYSETTSPTSAGAIRSQINNSTGAYSTSSDAALKTEIEYMANVLDGVTNLRAATYRYRDTDEDAQRAVGFIAQEVQQYFPELVYDNPDTGFLGLAYSDFAVLAIQAIGEQQEIIDEQQAIIDAQARELERLQTQQDSIEDRLSRLEMGR